ncbi:MAG: sugar ABC transporter permease [Limnochordaceae bacterium]|nr:sugar ABC transporter permease [Limnochordaceae bacterium]
MAVQGALTGPRPQRMSLARREAWEGYGFVALWLVGFVVFYAGPMVASLLLSFTSWNLIGRIEWAGLDNYRQLVHDPIFWQSLKVTGIYASIAVPLDLFAALILATLLNQKIRAVGWYRTLYYIPTILPGVVTAMVWRWVFNPQIGLINQALALVGINGPLWLASPQWALPAIIVMSLWTIGGSMVIFLGGLQGVPVQLHEAAEIDGAGSWTRFWRITVPLVSPTIFFNLITGMIGAFQVFTLPYIMTQGGPQYATEFYVLYLYDNAFTFHKMGYASAMAWIMFLIVVVLTLAQFRLSKRWVYYAGGDTL